MYGFTLKIGIGSATSDIQCDKNFIHKFENDKIFYENPDYIIILDGVILNKSQLLIKNNWAETVIHLYEHQGDDFFKMFRGCFSGAIFNKKIRRWIIFSDHLGQKFIYYSLIKDTFICSSVITNIYDFYKRNGIGLELDRTGVSFLLSYGFMLDNYTLCKTIKKIRPGHYLVFQNGRIEEKEYFKLDNTPNEKVSYDEAIEKVDELFRHAVELQFEKDLEYGYRHVSALSGGLDCRMTTYVADTLGFKKQLNLTFSESGYWDHIIPQEMAIDWKHDWIYKPLDNGMWLMDVDDITKNTGGNVLYYGVAHSNSLYRYIDFNRLGLIHSGQLGDVVLGTQMKNYNEKYLLGHGAYSSKFFKFDFEIPNFTNLEMGLWYCRYLNGTNNGLQNTFNYTETCSPFLDIDFLTYCLSLPVSYRYQHRLYKDWVLKKYPDASNYIWATTGARIDERIIFVHGHMIPSKHIPSWLLLKLKQKFGFAKYSMQQLDDYLNNNKELKVYLSEYLKYAVFLQDEELKNYVIGLWENGTSNEKIQAVSLLSAIKMYFSN